jgi:hypothetical protein
MQHITERVMANFSQIFSFVPFSFSFATGKCIWWHAGSQWCVGQAWDVLTIGLGCDWENKSIPPINSTRSLEVKDTHTSNE